MYAFIDEHRDHGVQMMQGRDDMIFEIDCQHDDGSLTIRVKSHLLAAIRSRRSRAFACMNARSKVFRGLMP
jgi:hypothetical protein